MASLEAGTRVCHYLVISSEGLIRGRYGEAHLRNCAQTAKERFR